MWHVGFLLENINEYTKYTKLGNELNEIPSVDDVQP